MNVDRLAEALANVEGLDPEWGEDERLYLAVQIARAYHEPDAGNSGKDAPDLSGFQRDTSAEYRRAFAVASVAAAGNNPALRGNVSNYPASPLRDDVSDGDGY